MTILFESKRLIFRLFAEGDLDVLNTPASRVLEKTGFRREAHFVENLWFKGRWASEYWYWLLHSEWNERRAKND